MKFNQNIPVEYQEVLEKEYREYIKKTPMTPNELHALREWVEDGNSVYSNDMEAAYSGSGPIEFLVIYRENEDIRKQTKGMNAEETRKFAMNYYGWEDDLSKTTGPAERDFPLDGNFSF